MDRQHKNTNKHLTYIIAEAGVNHNGSLRLAKKLVDKAVWAGADCIKFQTFNSDKLVVKNAPKANYQKKDNKQYRKPARHAKKAGIDVKTVYQS